MDADGCCFSTHIFLVRSDSYRLICDIIRDSARHIKRNDCNLLIPKNSVIHTTNKIPFYETLEMSSLLLQSHTESTTQVGDRIATDEKEFRFQTDFEHTNMRHGFPFPFIVNSSASHQSLLNTVTFSTVQVRSSA
ncbi:hypothetical protein FGIG_06795 [Fasciola gigantica]|uniref:Uncharacterized protein n=1 Tax=Fasciola gigantica TaxID=46835 RepID=A0A504Z6Y9_FASGI|nr:hypothetical protein FGIG_06795 [Fasciola gigantica]